MGHQNEQGATTVLEDLWQNWYDWFTHQPLPHLLSVMEILAFCQELWHVIGNCCCLWYVQGIAEGEIFSEWKIDTKKVMDLHTFQDHLSTQGLEYLPVYRQYPGHKAMRVYTKLILKDWKKVFEEEDTHPQSLPLHQLEVWLLLPRISSWHQSNFEVPNNIGPSQDFVEMLAIYQRISFQL